MKPQPVDNQNWPLNSMLVSRNHKLMYMPIAKTANTTLKRVFVQISDLPDREEILRGDVHPYLIEHKTGLSLCDYDPVEAAELLQRPDYFRFIVVRNPFTRLVSGYLDKFVVSPFEDHPHEEAPGIVRPAIEWVYRQRGEDPDMDQSISFEEFVAYLCAHDDRFIDTHFKPQSSYMAGIKFDLVHRMENLSRLLDRLEQHCGLSIRREHRNRTRGKRRLLRRKNQHEVRAGDLARRSSLPGESELLTSSLADKLAQRYSDDVEIWNNAAQS